MHISILRDKDDSDHPAYYVKLSESGPFRRFVLMKCLSLEDAETLATGMSNIIKFSCAIDVAQDFIGVWP